jgi:hypothetical protein
MSFDFWIHIGWTLSLVACFEAARRFLRSRERRGLGLALSVWTLGVFIVAMQYGASVVFWQGHEKILDAAEKLPVPSSIANRPAGELSEQERVFGRALFARTGELLSYADSKGTTLRYQPNLEEIRSRESLVAARAVAAAKTQSMRSRAIWMSLSLLLATSVGFFLGWQERR